jgi:hypothetical protein
MKQSVSCKSYIHLFSLIWLFWLFSGYSAGYASADESSISLSGFIQLRYDGRYLSDDSGEDHKLHQIADISIKENEWGHFRFNLCGDMTEDLDGEADDDEVDRTRTIRDTWDSSTHGFLYVCQGEIYQLGFVDYARFGRQYVNHELSTTHVDGFVCLNSTSSINVLSPLLMVEFLFASMRKANIGMPGRLEEVLIFIGTDGRESPLSIN